MKVLVRRIMFEYKCGVKDGSGGGWDIPGIIQMRSDVTVSGLGIPS